MKIGTRSLAASSALALAAAAGTVTAGDDTQEWRIIFDVTDGTLAGQQFEGSITFSTTDLIQNFTDGVLVADGPDDEFTFDVTLPNGVVLTIADDIGDAGSLFFEGFDLAGLNYVGDNFADGALTTFDTVDNLSNVFEVFTDADFTPDGAGTFSFERVSEEPVLTRVFDVTNTVIDDTDIVNIPSPDPEDDDFKEDMVAPDTNFNGALGVSVDLDDGPGDFNPRQVLIRFNDIIGDGPNQVPLGSTILGAAFRVEIISPGSGFTAHRILTDWDVDTVTWNNFDANGEGGVQADGVEAVLLPDDEELGVRPPLLTVDLTASLQAFADGETNNGFALLPIAEGTDGVDFFTSEAPEGVPLDFFPPLLTVELADGTTRTFQEAQNGYAGTSDTTLTEGSPDLNLGSLNTTSIDLSDGGFIGQYLLRFDDVFGTGDDQIDPATDVVTSATVTVRSTSRGEDVTVYALNDEFDETRATWNTFDNGIDPDRQFEFFFAPETPEPGEPADPGTVGFSGNGMTVSNPGLSGEDTPIGIGVEDQFDGGPEAINGFLLVERPTEGRFAVRSLDPTLTNYGNFDVLEFALRDVGDLDPGVFEIRVGVGNGGNFWVSNAGFAPTENWEIASVDLRDASQWTQVIGTGTFADALANADRLQLRHETLPIADGQSADDAAGDIGFDYITFCSSDEVDCTTVDLVNTRFDDDNPDYFEAEDGDDFMVFNITNTFQNWTADPASNQGLAFLPVSTNGFDFDAEGTLRPPTGPQLFVAFSPAAAEPACNAADVAAPFGFLNSADVTTFVNGFRTANELADIAAPFGVLNSADVTTFVNVFQGGCP